MGKITNKNQLFLIAFIIFLVINSIAFLIMLVDKVKSRKSGKHRISEGLLFFMATALGSIGVYAGMFILKHKIRKWYFVIGIPLLIVQNFALLYLIYSFLDRHNFIK